MIPIVFISATAASAFNAASSILEREAARSPDIGKLFSKRLIKTISKNKKFLTGILLQVFASILEVIALSQGPLLLVGPLLTTDLVFLWIIIRYRYKRSISIKSWLSVSAIIFGLASLYILTQPRNGHANFKLVLWISAFSTLVLLIAASVYIVNRVTSKKLQAGILGFTTAFNYALDAGLVKLVFNQLHHGGYVTVFTSWPLYTLVVLAILSVILTQNTYSAGPLVISQPIIEIVQAITSALIGIFIFNDLINKSIPLLIGDGFSISVLITGIYMLSVEENLFDYKATD